MNILAFTDSHFDEHVDQQLIDKAKDVDIVICAGDFTNFGRNIDQIIKDFLKFEKPVLIIPGNHEEGEDFKRFRKFKNLKFIHKSGFVLEDYLFVGYGGGGFSERYRDFESIIPKIKLRKRDRKIILVTHAPVYGTTTDYLDHAGHVGSKSSVKFIKEINPLLVICGHIEENSGQIDNIGKTIIVNPGSEGSILEI
jgi:uncharacterized protein